MSNHHEERYDFEITEEGLDYDILDRSFNPTTQAFIERNGIKPGMRVLDVGSGSGLMTHYLSQQVGQQGQVLSVDISAAQLARAKQYCDRQDDKNILFKELSVYDLDKHHETFDLIYCRFVLHHLHSPREAIKLFYDRLNKGGFYIAEEGIISAAFSYPPSKAWHYNRQDIPSPDNDVDGVQRDGDFGMKLVYWMKKSGFKIQGSRYLVKDFGTSKSPKSTRQRAKYFGRDCPAPGTLR